MPGPGVGLDLPTLIDEIKQAEIAAQGATTPDLARDIFATKLGQAIDKFVRSGKVITNGSSTTQQGTVT